MSKPLRAVGLCGSLRAKSFNAMALREAIKASPGGMTIEVGEIRDLPLYDQDVFDAGLPEPVKRLREQVGSADAILFVTPEYNYSIPGALKNAIDWLSRPPSTPLMGKPCAIMGASMRMFGTARAQYHLRQVCVFLDMKPVNKPEVFLGEAHKKFDATTGALTDDKAKEKIRELLIALKELTVRFAG